jgi:hypothetical protein
MVRTLVFDKTANEAFKKILDESKSNSGLLVGCVRFFFKNLEFSYDLIFK